MDITLVLVRTSVVPLCCLSLSLFLTVPAAPLEMTVVDIGPTSVQLEWMFGDNGGAVENGIHVTFVTLEQEMEVVVNIDIDPGQTSALIEGFMDNTPYRCLLYTSPSPRDATLSRMPSSA